MKVFFSGSGVTTLDIEEPRSTRLEHDDLRSSNKVGEDVGEALMVRFCKLQEG